MVNTKCSKCGATFCCPRKTPVSDFICGNCKPMKKRSAKKISSGVYEYRGFRLSDCGYYHPDHCIWWEAVKDGCAWFHAHTKKDLMIDIDEYMHENKNQWKSVRAIARGKFEKIADYEKTFETTIHRTKSVNELADSGKVYPGCKNIDLVRQSKSMVFDKPIISEDWKLPSGAFGESNEQTSTTAK